MKYISTRNKNNVVEPLEGVLKGIAEDGGLFVPEEFPQLTADELEGFCELTYPEVAADILARFIDLDKDELLALTTEAYASFDSEKVVPVVKLTENEFVMELWHGPTLAFKDMALQILPRLMSRALAREEGKKALILTATSGDTGKAAMEGFRDVPNTFIVVFYPSEGVSDMQKLQMTTQQGGNVCVCAVEGNFDDAQTAVKRLFTDPEFNKLVNARGYSLSSANSINLGRLVPQIAYYVYAYSRLRGHGDIEQGEKINFVVPTGNFGNILAAYYAKRMGLPIARLICASNSNNVLTDFFRDGEYTLEREFYKTMSPSMDILVSSNLERLLFELCGRDDETVREWMRSLSEDGEFEVELDMVDKMEETFFADFCDDIATSANILKTFNEHHYLLDTHTAVASAVYDEYVFTTDDETKTVVVSTANPYKFAQDVYFSLSGGRIDDPFEAAHGIEKITEIPEPERLRELADLPIRFTQTAAKDALGEVVLRAID